MDRTGTDRPLLVNMRPQAEQPSEVPVLAQLLARTENALQSIEGLLEVLHHKLDTLGAPEVPVPAGGPTCGPSRCGVLLTVEVVAQRAEIASLRLELHVRRLCGAV